MSINEETEAGVKGVLDATWAITNGTVVPSTEDVTLKNGGRLIDATYLYADLADSSWLAQEVDREIVGKVIRTYLNAATRLLNYHGGEIRSFDGDRVMAIFMGNLKNTSAVKAAFSLNWAVQKVIRPKLRAKWSVSLANYTMNHGVGIDTGNALIVRGGVRNHNDLVSIGAAPNIAAKLSELRKAPDIYITKGVHDHMIDEVKKKLDGTTSIWTRQTDEKVGGATVTVYGAAAGYWRKPGA